jgi:hypothetical protein
VTIPLRADRLTTETYLGNYPVSASTNLHGTLNANALGLATMTFHPGMPPAAIGRTIWMAAIVQPEGELPQHTSIAVAFTILP